MIHSRKPEQFHIVQEILTTTNSPTTWTDISLSKKLKGEVVIGYLFKSIKSQFDTWTRVLNLYTISEEYLTNKRKVIPLCTIQNTFLQWLESLAEDEHSKMFRNPPVKEWMDTKDNWIKKLSHKLSLKYKKPFEDCRSSVYYTIMKCYSKGHVYMGNLSYVSKAAENDIKLDYRFMTNRLTINHPAVVSFEQHTGGNKDGTDELKIIDLVGTVDPYHKESDFEELKADIIKDLRHVFSPREIDQIINARGYISMTIYRKLLKWQKAHKRRDYGNE
jgi:hypothetical protein